MAETRNWIKRNIYPQEERNGYDIWEENKGVCITTIELRKNINNRGNTTNEMPSNGICLNLFVDWVFRNFFKFYHRY